MLERYRKELATLRVELSKARQHAGVIRKRGRELRGEHRKELGKMQMETEELRRDHRLEISYPLVYSFCS